MSILVLTTGGTISALAYQNLQSPPDMSIMPPPGIDLVQGALTQSIFNFASVRCVSLEQRDSKLIDNAYREHMLHVIQEAPEKKILITHGTDRILESADYFYHQRIHGGPLLNKTVIFTGSMIPLANGVEADGYLNLTYALHALMDIDPSTSENNGAIFIVLCDYAFPETESGLWQPRLYRYHPDHYKKFYAKDGRYSRLIRVSPHEQY